ncbi:MAG: DNA translocase FtsK 4TM domain-containing protein [Planctomycetota bacterium]
MALKKIAREGLLILAILICLYALVSMASFTPADIGALVHPPNEVIRNNGGLVGAHLAHYLLHRFGMSAYPLVLLLGAWAGILLVRKEFKGLPVKLTGSVLFVFCAAAANVLLGGKWTQPDTDIGPGGALGIFLVNDVGRPYVGTLGTIIVIFMVGGVSLVLATDLFFINLGTEAWKYLRDRNAARRERRRIRELAKPVRAESIVLTHPGPAAAKEALKPAPAPLPAIKPAEKPPGKPLFAEKPAPKPKPVPEPAAPKKKGDYILPGAGLLDMPEAGAESEKEQTIREKAEILQKKLMEFQVNAQVVAIDRGPVVTVYEIALAAGTKVHRVMALNDDISMALKAPVRIVFPIPGKSTVGVEVPNSNKHTVRIRSLVEAVTDARKRFHLPLFLGQDTSGAPLVSDLAGMPHLLIAGATGSGKTVCLNSVILSLLLTRTPDEVNLILVDPKMVELSAYKDLPHLAAPVVTEMKKAAGILDWAVAKMDERYELLAQTGVRDIHGFNALGEAEVRKRLFADEEPQEPITTHLPFFIIIVDELADLMMTASNEVEVSITRLAQKSRAVGIHIILATQRPSVDVITGLIKANLPSRLSFQVASKVDSRTILDRNGAERLLGKGDMLFLPPGSSDLVRAQGAFIADGEVERVVEFCRKQRAPEFQEELLEWKTEEVGAMGENDDLYEDAVRLILSEKRGSASLLQRAFGIGYTRASRLVDTMGRQGLVGSYKGSQAREVLMSLEEWESKRADDGGRKAGGGGKPAGTE